MKKHTNQLILVRILMLGFVQSAYGMNNPSNDDIYDFLMARKLPAETSSYGDLDNLKTRSYADIDNYVAKSTGQLRPNNPSKFLTQAYNDAVNDTVDQRLYKVDLTDLADGYELVKEVANTDKDFITLGKMFAKQFEARKLKKFKAAEMICDKGAELQYSISSISSSR